MTAQRSTTCGRGPGRCPGCGGGRRNRKAASEGAAQRRLHLTYLRDVVTLPSEPRAGILPLDSPAQERVPALYTRPVPCPMFTTRVTLQRSSMSHWRRACVCV